MDSSAVHHEGALGSVHFLALWSRTEVRWGGFPMEIHEMIFDRAFKNLGANCAEVTTL